MTEDEVLDKTPPGCNEAGVDVNKSEIIDDTIVGGGGAPEMVGSGGAPKGSPSLEMEVPGHPEGSLSLGIGITDETPCLEMEDRISTEGAESSLDKGAKDNLESIGDE